MEMNSNNPSPSSLPPCPSFETNNNNLAPPPPPPNSTGSSKPNQVNYVANGIPPPPNSSNNRGRKPRARKFKSAQQTNIMPPPQFSPLNTHQQGFSAPPPQPLLHPMIRPAQSPMLHPMQQRPSAPPQQHSRQMMEQFIQQTKMPRGISRLVTEVMHYQWDRPQLRVEKNNTIEFWREFVAIYYDPNAKERWCLSMCQDNSIPLSKDGRPCNLCGAGPLRGYEVGFEGLPQRFKAKFDVVMGERLHPGMAGVQRVPGLTIWWYPQTTHRSIYGPQSVFYKGLLRVAITDQRKILYWEFCAGERETFASIRRFPSPENWYEIREVVGRTEAKNVADETSEENLHRNNHMVMQQVYNGEGQGINNITMNSTTAVHPIATKNINGSNHHRFICEQNSDRTSSKPAAVGANAVQAAGLPVNSIETSLLGNAAAHLQPISHNFTMSNSRAMHNKGGSSHVTIIGGQNGAAGPPRSGGVPISHNNNTSVSRATTHNTGRSSHVIIGGQNGAAAGHISSHDQQNEFDVEMLGDGMTGGVYISEVAAMEDEDEDDIERYLIDNPAGQFLTQEMQGMNHQGSEKGKLIQP